MRKNVYKLIILFLAVFCMAGFAYGYSGAANVVVEGDYIEASDGGAMLGAISGTDVYQDMIFFGEVNLREGSRVFAPAATTTLSLFPADSGSTLYLSASGSVITLPAVSEGLNYRFVINGAATTENYVIASAEGDNMEGTLIVAGAVVDCAGEDQLNFIVDGENVGDYVEVRSDGTQWLIGDSGVLTSAKLTCTDPS